MDTEADRIKNEIENIGEKVEYLKLNLESICNHLGIDEKEKEKEVE